MSGGDSDDIAERVLVGFRDAYRSAAPFREDRERADPLALEARPAVDSLLLARGESGLDLDSADHHEALAMITLLGRRAAELGVTPTAALALVPSLLSGFRQADHPLPDALDEHLRALSMEGFVASREEQLRVEADRRAADALAIVRVAPRCLALFLRGTQEPEHLSEVVDRFGRALLEHDAAACVVDLSDLAEPSSERAAEVFGADAAARMLGARCVFAGVSDAWLDAARQARVDTELLASAPHFEQALHRALEACGFTLRRTGRLRGLLTNR